MPSAGRGLSQTAVGMRRTDGPQGCRLAQQPPGRAAALAAAAGLDPAGRPPGGHHGGRTDRRGHGGSGLPGLLRRLNAPPAGR